MREVVSAFAVAVAMTCVAAAGTSRPARTRVPVTTPSSATGIVRPVDPVVPTVPPQIEIQPVGAVDLCVLTAPEFRAVPASERIALAVPYVSHETLGSFSSVDVARVFAIVSACPSAIGIPVVFEALVSSATREEFFRIVAECFARTTRTLVRPDMPVSDVGRLRDIWYETFRARGGSRLWAICAKARIYAERGEDIEELRRVFVETLKEWAGKEDE